MAKKEHAAKVVKKGDDRWWDFIDRARKSSEGLDDMPDTLAELLVEELTADEILQFDKFINERLRDAYRGDLWGIAYIMNGGCSDDGFDYFCGWLVAKGKKHYEAALAKPEDAAKNVSADDEPFEVEEILYIGSRAWEEKTGKTFEDYEKVAASVGRELIGELFDEDEIYDQYPKLTKKFA